jgi:hypothetical protein
VISDAGKRTEKVQISQTPAMTFIARRENEPALYELDANTVKDLRQSAADVKEAAAEPQKKK